MRTGPDRWTPVRKLARKLLRMECSCETEELCGYHLLTSVDDRYERRYWAFVTADEHLGVTAPSETARDVQKEVAERFAAARR